MSKILIIGGAGFIGSHLTYEFIKDKHEVSVIDNNTQYFYPLSNTSIKNMEYRHNFLLKGAKIFRANTMDVNDLRRLVINLKPEYIVNLASLPLAVTAVKKTEEAFSSILDSARNLMEIIIDVSFLKNYVHISSSMVYGDFQKNPNPENASKDPIEIYGSMKLASEYLVKGYAQRFNFPLSIIRPSAAYGPVDNNYRVIQKFLESALRKEKIVANNPSTNKLDFTFVKDVVQGIKLATLTKQDKIEEFNITRGESRSLEEVINIIKKHFPTTKFEIKQDNNIYPKRGTLDISKAKKVLKFSPKFSLEDGIKNYIEFYKENKLI